MSETKPQSEDMPEQDAGLADDVQAAESAPTEDAVELAHRERDEYHERWVRSQAELENFRKRAQREMEEMRRYQALPVVRDLLPGLDNLERAVSAAATSSSVEDLVAGIRMVQQQFEAAFADHGAKPIPAAGEPFDPNLHEAIQQMPSNEHPPMTVIQELEKGYAIGDRVIRPSKVIVSVAGPDPGAQDAGDSQKNDE